MKKFVRSLFLIVSATAMLAACGGGGGGAPASPQATTKEVSGTIDLSSGASAAKAAAGADLPVQISSYDSSGTMLSGGSVAATTNAAGQFSARVPVVLGGYVLVDIVKEGYSEFHKRVDFKDSVNDVNVPGTVDKATTAIQKIASYSAYSSVGIKASANTFSFAVMRFPNGIKKAVAGATAIRAAKAANATTELNLQIPADTLPGVSSLKADLNTYEPATDSAKFPGSYTADYNGKQGKMVSLAFDYIKITDADSGESLGKVAKKLVKAGVKKAAAANTVYTRWIPGSSCDTLFQFDDFDTTLSGRQVPVWTLNPNNGKWEFLGVGTIYDTDSAATPSSSPSSAVCKASGYYLKINVTNETFLKSYWNLDHIVFPSASGPKKVCVGGTVTNGDSSVYLSLYGNGFESAYTKIGADGKYSLETVLLNEKEAGRSATLSYTDSFGNYKSEIITLGDYPSCTTKDITLDAPGTVTGTVKNDAGLLAYKGVQLRGVTSNRYVYTDVNGAFTAKVKKGEDISVYLGYNSTAAGTFNINNTTSDYTLEKTDDGTTVTLNDITVTNQAPMANARLSSYSIKVGKTVTATIYANDEEGDYPVAYSLKTGNTVLASGSIAAGSSYATADLTPAVGNYPLSLTVTDSKGNARSINLGSLEVAAGNRTPSASIYAARSFVPKITDGIPVDVNFNAYAQDLDGDNLSYTVKLDGATIFSGTGSNGYVYKNDKFTIPVSTPLEQQFVLTFEVTDGTATASTTTTVTYGLNHAPTVVAAADKTLIAEGATGTARDVTCTASGYDMDGDTLTYVWFVDNVVQAGAANPSFTFTIPSTATLGQVFTIKVLVSDGAKDANATCQVTYGATADVSITVQ